MQYFAPEDQWPERAGKVIGDVIALAAFIFFLGLMVEQFL